MKVENQGNALPIKVVGAIMLALMASHCAPTLVGRLTGPDGEPITNSEARVNVAPLAEAAQAKDARTVVVPVDAAGTFAVKDDLTPGSYLVEALVPGYGIVSQKITLGEDKEVKLQLAPLPKTKARAIGANVDADGGRGAGGATLTPPSL